MALSSHSGFVPFDCPIWTDFVVGTSDSAYFFLVRATEKTKTVPGQKIPQKNYRSAKC